MTALTETIQKANPGARVALFRLDVSKLGGSIAYFTQSAYHDAPIEFGGISYTPVDVEFSGMEIVAGGTLPRPRIKVSNANGVFQQMLNTYGDLLGCEISRIRTFAQFLDGAPEEDPAMYAGPDTFRVERKLKETPVYIEWELSAHLDNAGKQLPGRQCIRDTCMWRYRSYNSVTGVFDYSRALCPYTGSNYFDRSGEVAALASGDRCGRKLSDCELRFGKKNALPFGGFPGMGRVR